MFGLWWTTSLKKILHKVRFRIERIAIDAKWQSKMVSTLAINPSSRGLRPNHRNLGSPDISQRPVSSGLKLKLCNVRVNTGTALLWVFRIHVGNCSEITLHTLHSTITWRLCFPKIHPYVASFFRHWSYITRTFHIMSPTLNYEGLCKLLGI